jgi:glutamine amidotransferase
MCLLVVASPNSTPKRKDLECASCNNPHGFGYAVITPSGIVTGRGMSSKKIIKQFLDVRKQFPDSYALFHARYATHGVKNDDNCHPFKVPNSPADTYLAHNGVLDIKITAGDRRSDTRIFAEDTLPAMGGVKSLDEGHVWSMLSKWSSGNKIVILTLDPMAKEVCYIVNESLGHWDDEGMWWSNNSYKEDRDSIKWASYSLPLNESYSAVDSNYGDYTCSNCSHISNAWGNPYYCDMCLICYDCNGTQGETCMCWTPERDKNKHTERGWYYE